MELKILGIAQDGGIPQLNCQCSICKKCRKNNRKLFPTSLLIKTANGNILFDATNELQNQITVSEFKQLNTIVLSHAHVGHYTGLIQLGFEISNRKNITTFASARMKQFLLYNQPWKTLVDNKNINLKTFTVNNQFAINKLCLQPLKVPHREEHSDCFGFIIQNKLQVLFIPDIKSWKQKNLNLCKLIKQVDLAFVDGTFFNHQELPRRNLNKIGHPFIVDTIRLLSSLKKEDKNKVNFIHLNHTNPAVNKTKTKEFIHKKGFQIATQGKTYQL
jgi:pyrroloquinoline quinone biosynthesis protein B